MIKFKPEQATRNKIRLNGESSLTFETTINKNFVMPITSDFARKHKLLIYPDILYKGNVKITVINLSPIFVDLERDDILADLKSLQPPATNASIN